MSLRTKYSLLKATTIVISALSIPWSTYTGFCFGEGRYLEGIIALSLQTAVSLVDGFIWFWVLENMKNRLENEQQFARYSRKKTGGQPLIFTRFI